MKISEFNQLSTYNSEIGRGLLHTEEWKARMQLLQEEYNREIAKSDPRVWPPYFIEPDDCPS